MEIIDLTTPVARLMREWKSENTAYDTADEAFDAGEISGDQQDQNVEQYCDREDKIVQALIDTEARGWRDVKMKLQGLSEILGIQWADDRDVKLLDSVLDDFTRLLGR